MRRSSVPVLVLVAIALALIGLVSAESMTRVVWTTVPSLSPTSPPPHLVPWPPVTARPTPAPLVGEFHTVTRVVDGDTVELDNKRAVRYLGIDAPEIRGRGGAPECLAFAATERNHDLVGGWQVRLVRDVTDTDRYGRLLRYVYVDSRLVNETLIAEGYAKALTIPPDVRYRDRFRMTESSARAARRGLWGEACAASGTGTPAPESRPDREKVPQSASRLP